MMTAHRNSRNVSLSYSLIITHKRDASDYLLEAKYKETHFIHLMTFSIKAKEKKKNYLTLVVVFGFRL